MPIDPMTATAEPKKKLEAAPENKPETGRVLNPQYEEQAKHFSNASSGYGESLLAEEDISEESLFSLGSNATGNHGAVVGDLLGILKNAGIL